MYYPIISRRVLLRTKDVSDKSCTVNQHTHFVFRSLFLKSCRFWDNAGKYRKDWQATDDNKAHTLCMLDTQAEKYILRIRNTDWFSPATMVAWKRASMLRYTCIVKHTIMQACKQNDWKYYLAKSPMLVGFFLINFITVLPSLGDRGSTVVKALRYKSEGRWFDFRWCQWNFSLT